LDTLGELVTGFWPHIQTIIPRFVNQPGAIIRRAVAGRTLVSMRVVSLWIRSSRGCLGLGNFRQVVALHWCFQFFGMLQPRQIVNKLRSTALRHIDTLVKSHVILFYFYYKI
jgi:hypothetical protein